MENYIESLSKCLLFNGIKTQELTALLGCMQSKVIEFDKNKTVMQEGKVFDKLGILLEGNLQVVQYDYLGNRTIISTVEPLQIFGEAFSYVKTKFPMNVETTEKSKVLFLISDRISNPCPNGCVFHKQLTFLTLESIKQNSKEFYISYDRQSLADYLGVERSAMSAELGKLRKDGVIECEKNWFKLL